MEFIALAKVLVEAHLVKRFNKKKDRSEWALVSRKKPVHVLRWFGLQKPSADRVAKEEKRIQYFKHMGG